MSILTEEQVQSFHEFGYLAFERFFDEAECAALKADIDDLMAARQSGTPAPFICEYPHLGPLISHPRVMDVVESVMGPGFAFHHLHAVRQGAGTSGSDWHQDYEQEPQTNRRHIMVHFFYYFNGLNGEVGDLLFVPKSQNLVLGSRNLSLFGTENLPGTMVVNNIPPGSAVLVHSALWHARRPKPGGEKNPRYFADASYCQAGARWPSYGAMQWREILAKARERGLDRGGRYAHLFDEAQFFDHRAAREFLKGCEGSLVLQMKGWEE